MTFKKFLPMASLVMLMAFSFQVSSAAIVSDSSQTENPSKTENPRVQQINQRLEVIKEMDKSELTNSEKRALRKEVKGMKHEMKSISGGVYLSVGAVIIIVLLLIILL